MTEAVPQAFRQSFKVSKELLKWYPGHMEKGMLKMQAKLKNIDCVIEVHDARVALSGRNPNFVKRLLGIKPHILVLNKSDLILERDMDIIKSKLKEDGIDNVIFTNCRQYRTCPGIKKIIPTSIKLVSSVPRYNRREETDLNMMVIGIPNVGKSSLINAMRMKNLDLRCAARVGPMAGVTRKVQGKIQVNIMPSIFFIDTPGILPPNISSTEVGLKLALCACLKDSVVGSEIIADFFLYWVNKSGDYTYVDILGLDGPKDNINDVLSKIAVDYKLVKNVKDIRTNSIVKMIDFHQAANVLLDMFRVGKLGLINLDKDLLSQQLNESEKDPDLI